MTKTIDRLRKENKDCEIYTEFEPYSYNFTFGIYFGENYQNFTFTYEHEELYQCVSKIINDMRNDIRIKKLERLLDE